MSSKAHKYLQNGKNKNVDEIERTLSSRNCDFGSLTILHPSNSILFYITLLDLPMIQCSVIPAILGTTGKVDFFSCLIFFDFILMFFLILWKYINLKGNSFSVFKRPVLFFRLNFHISSSTQTTFLLFLVFLFLYLRYVNVIFFFCFPIFSASVHMILNLFSFCSSFLSKPIPFIFRFFFHKSPRLLYFHLLFFFFCLLLHFLISSVSTVHTTIALITFCKRIVIFTDAEVWNQLRNLQSRFSTFLNISFLLFDFSISRFSSSCWNRKKNKNERKL